MEVQLSDELVRVEHEYEPLSDGSQKPSPTCSQHLEPLGLFQVTVLLSLLVFMWVLQYVHLAFVSTLDQDDQKGRKPKHENGEFVEDSHNQVKN